MPAVLMGCEIDMHVKHLIRRFRRQTGRVLDPHAEQLVLNQGRLLAHASADADFELLSGYEFKAFSQWGEDGIIQHLIRSIPIAEKTFIEFGVEDFAESNCRFLMMKDNWSGFVIDGSPENIKSLQNSYYYWKHDLSAIAAFITPENVEQLLGRSGFSDDLGILSIDIDGMDYWVLERIKSFRPRILIVEYNAVFGDDRPISVPAQSDFQRSQAHYSNLYAGASLPAYRHWAAQNGYSFVGTNGAGSNAFFVRADIMTPATDKLAATATFTPSKFRESRGADGRLTLMSGKSRLAAIANMPVTNVVTGSIETL